MAGKIELLRGVGMSADELGALLADKFSLADRIVIDSGPGASQDQKATIETADFVVVVEDASWGAEEGSSVLEEVCQKAGKEVVVIPNKGDDFPQVDKLQEQLRAGKLPRQMKAGVEELLSYAADATVIGVVGGKGGVGKTTIAACIALGVASDGGKVVLVDMDNQAGCITRVLTGKAMDKGERGAWVGEREAKHARRMK